MMNDALVAKNLHSCIGGDVILKDINFKIPSQGLTSIIGPSGAGKTTLLKIIAGFQPICQGQLWINNTLVSEKGLTLPPDKRQVGMVFQDNSLFPQLNVVDNIKTSLRSKRADAKHIAHLIEKLDLKHLINRYPHELSGGQQQRTALARALVARPEVILLDEPFANLNWNLQVSIGIELLDILNEQNTTAVMVTHDQHDAMAISNSMILLIDGKCIQQGTPEELYRTPKNKRVAEFLSRGSFIKGTLIDQHHADTDLGKLKIDLQSSTTKRGDVVDIWTHPENYHIDENSENPVQVINRFCRSLDVLLKVKTKNNEAIYIKAHHSDNRIQSENFSINMDRQIRYRAFA